MAYSESKRRNSGAVGWILVFTLCLAALTAISCRKPVQVGEIGKDINVPPLTYTIIRTEWKESLESTNGQRLPAQKYLLVSAVVKNEGTADVSMPLLSLVDQSGKEYLEQNKGDGVGDWMGLLRTVPAGGQLSGVLLFDVAPGSYNLRVTSGGDFEKETTALVRLPYQVEAPGAATPQSLPNPIGH